MKSLSKWGLEIKYAVMRVLFQQGLACADRPANERDADYLTRKSRAQTLGDQSVRI